jgi:type IV pilus assembly protein PilY1
MNYSARNILFSLTTALITLSSGAPALADDTELFVGDSSAQEGAYPNLLFILDNSGSMGNQPSGSAGTSQSYDPNTVYTGACQAGRTYYLTGGNNGRGNLPDPPDCDSGAYFNSDVLMCASASDPMNVTGFYTDSIARWDTHASDSSQHQWEDLNTADTTSYVECRADEGDHGGTPSPLTDVYAANGNAGPWSSTRRDRIQNWNRNFNTTTLYTSNYLNYYWSIGVLQNRTKLEIVQAAAVDLLNSMNNVNVGLINFDTTSQEEGGDVIVPMGNIDTSRTGMIDQINAMTAQTWTPLSETMYEAGLYYMGDKPDYGDRNRRSVDSSRTVDGIYESPILFECQNNFVILLTDGEPTRDSSANTEIAALNGGCDPNRAPMASQDGHCLDDMAQYMYENDVMPDMAGVQNVTTYTIGFDTDFPLISDTALKGGGEFYLANDAKSLANVLTAIVRNILNTQTSFVAPTVSVNAFNRTQTRDDLYVALFSPDSHESWPGNLKKFRLRDGQIVGSDLTTPVVDPLTGFLRENSQSIWSVGPDGDNVRAGGAASRLPAPDSRRILTNLNPASTALSTISESNTALLTYFEGMADVRTPEIAVDVVKHILGVDVRDENQNNDRTEQRFWMGDPLHSKPEMITYGGSESAPDSEDNVLYAATNDGILHAIDPSTGVEKWAFIPHEMLELQPALYWNATYATRRYGIDGNVRSVIVDANQDGIINPTAGDRAYLFFGLRRGGSYYYGLDITNQDAPEMMWSLSAADLPGLGQTWSTPTPMRVKIGSGVGQNPKLLALAFGAGYDTLQDNGPYVEDTQGNGIFIIDALSGNRLWHAGSSGSTNFTSDDFTNAIVSDIRALELSRDGLTDRLYATDLGGQVWRFDLWNGESADNFATGGVIASLGGVANQTDPIENRRFYYAPDAALVTRGAGNRFMHLGVGSGYRAHPLDKSDADRFYAIRDFNPFSRLTQAEYDAITPVLDGDLVDVTTDVTPSIAPGDPGWKIQLSSGGLTGTGEKVLSESRTFADTVFFTTFTPGANVNPCQPGQGLNKLYAVSVVDGRPVNNLDGVGSDDDLTVDDRVQDLAMGGIAPEIVFLFPDPNTCTTGDCQMVYGFVGLEGIGNLNLPPYVRTYWEQAGSE